VWGWFGEPRGVLARRCGCGARWRNDVPWCPRKSMQPRCHEALCHGPPKGPPPSNCNPVASSRRASTFIALARSTTQQPASPAPPPLPPPLRPTTPSALRVYLLPIGRRPQPGRLIPTLARHVAESTAGWTPRRLPVRTVQARAARYAHGCSTCTWLFPFADYAQVNPPSERFAVQSRQPRYEMS
jgi:hypothetical protein